MAHKKQPNISSADRMVEIVLLLCQGKKISSIYLAQYFNVSVRTTRRDLSRIAWLLEPCDNSQYKLNSEWLRQINKK